MFVVYFSTFLSSSLTFWLQRPLLTMRQISHECVVEAETCLSLKMDMINVNCQLESYSCELNSWRYHPALLKEWLDKRDGKHIGDLFPLNCWRAVLTFIFNLCVFSLFPLYPCVCVSELKASIDRLTQMLEGMYSDNSLCQVRHALTHLIHSDKQQCTHKSCLIFVMPGESKRCPPTVRYLTNSTQFWSTKARHRQAITGPTSTTTPTSAG